MKVKECLLFWRSLWLDERDQTRALEDSSSSRSSLLSVQLYISQTITSAPSWFLSAGTPASRPFSPSWYLLSTYLSQTQPGLDLWGNLAPIGPPQMLLRIKSTARVLWSCRSFTGCGHLMAPEHAESNMWPSFTEVFLQTGDNKSSSSGQKSPLTCTVCGTEPWDHNWAHMRFWRCLRRFPVGTNADFTHGCQQLKSTC